MKKILIIRTDINEKESSRCLTGVDSAFTMELYHKYRSPMCITANHMWSKYTLIDEKNGYMGTFDSMQKLIETYPERIKSEPLGKVLILTHEEWLDKANPEWREVKHYQYW
tara:strand:- start:1015 stop:1347 length:333 start_codon:yes stop_codon:yes gene_type:complete